MHAGPPHVKSIERQLPRWPGAVALLAVALAYAEESGNLTVGPRGLLPALVTALLVPILIAHLRGRHHAARLLALTVTAVVSGSVAASAVLLITTLPGRGVAAPVLLRDAALIWLTNVLVFAVWYWEVDGGGPARRRIDSHHSEDFLFPQLASDNRDWSPRFIDYLFLAFNTSTAFSPTDTAVLSHRAKLMMMAQATISLVVIAVIAARAVNVL